MGTGFVSRMQNFLLHPFSEEMDIISWALFVGLIVVFVILWSRVLAHIEPLGE